MTHTSADFDDELGPADARCADAAASNVQFVEYRTRWIYFSLFAWLQCTGRFMSLYYQNEGLSSEQIGIVFASGILLSTFSTPAISYLADTLTARRGPQARLFVFISCVLWVSLAFSLQLLRLPGLSLFWEMLLCRVLMDTCRPVSFAMVDAITISALTDRKRYGVERFYGACSWALVGVALGLAMDKFGTRVMHAGVPFAVVGVIVAVVCAGHPPARRSSEDAAFVESDGTLLTLLWSYVSCPVKVAFFFYAMALGCGMSVVENLLFLYFHSLDVSYFTCGLSILVTVMFEIPLFVYSKDLLSRFGPRGCLTIAGICYSCRVVGYTFVPDGAWVLFFEPMHGITIAFWQTASVEVMASITPPNLSATGQGFLSSLRAIGFCLGTLFGGVVIDSYGEATLYRGAAALVCLGLISYLVASIYDDFRTTRINSQNAIAEPLTT